jgi:hypothetical protein
MQAQARRELGEDVTLFERIHDGLGAVAKGDIVRLATKPQIVGKVGCISGWCAFKLGTVRGADARQSKREREAREGETEGETETEREVEIEIDRGRG